MATPTQPPPSTQYKLDTLKMQTLWIIGTTLQNKLSAQLAVSPPLNLDVGYGPDGDLVPRLRSPPQIPLPPIKLPKNPLTRPICALWAPETERCFCATDEFGGWMERVEDEIRVRRKTTFLLNTVLPVSSSQVNLQPIISLPTSETAPPQIHTNSHASMLSNPSSISMSALTLAAIQEEGEEESLFLLDALITALIEPVPFGVDGEMDKDDELPENIVRILYTFATSCNGVFSAVQKRSLLGSWEGLERHKEREI
ncbi:hypothetical protein DFJ58DRAFT_749985 [Suillus subalutaceus]|uniref:uncharacterized protein n=1 Tax=Suillus subalutaceus TaxID=48586 RepID=UPI001B87AB4E|nr:uncharacterized protein DFJ58DRAFT_749985 [Suillus subalutaceus]KAG1835961.1 hypothetical protein DFJ58DRAFT_749985 [Suillus subalutaceus]